MCTIKYFFIFLTSYYIYGNLLSQKIKFSLCLIIKCTVITSIFSAIYQIKSVPFSAILSYLTFYFVTLIFFHHPEKICFLSTLISYCFSNLILLFSSTLFGFIIFPFFRYTQFPPDIITYALPGALTFSFAHIPFKIDGCKKRIKYLYDTRFINIGTVIGIIILSAITLAQLIYQTNTSAPLDMYYLIVILAALLLFFLWQRYIHQYYLTKLRHLELESLRQELAEKDVVIEKLQANNELQARMIHKDNKLIPAMLSAVTEYLSMVDSNCRTMQEHGTMLAGQLKELADERLTVLTAASEAAATLPLLHRASVDAMLSYMQKRAMQENILFEVKIHPDFEQKIEISITEPDLTHLLSDLLENAIIATKTAADRHIFVHLGILYDAAVVEVSDSGQAFEPSVYQDFGLQKHSTHLDNGGSGIGLMDIWELKKKYAASLHIYEYAGEAAPFTKKISIVFDRKKHYLIRTFRPEELVKMQARSDLYILPLNDGKD